MQGLQVFDEDGDLMLDVTDRVTKVLGQLVIPSTVMEDSGTIEVPGLALGVPFFFTMGNEAKKDGYIDAKGWKHGFWLRPEKGFYYPIYRIPAYQVTITFEGTKLHWHVKKYSQWWVSILNSSFNIVYGVY